jgi:hypothetical protein
MHEVPCGFINGSCRSKHERRSDIYFSILAVSGITGVVKDE